METVLRTLLLLTVTGSILALIILALKPLIKDRLSFTWQYYIWLLVLARLCLPWFPAIEGAPALLPAPEVIAFSAAPLAAPPSTADALTAAAPPSTAEALTAAAPLSGDTASGHAVAAPPPDSLSAPTPSGGASPGVSLLFALWLAGASVLATKDLRGYTLFVRSIHRRSAAVSDAASLKLLRECRQALGIKREVALWRHPALPMPILVGVFKPRIVLPVYELDAEELRLVLLHELTHYRHRDNLIKWLANAAVWLHWFNPLAHLVRAEMEKASELACDEAMSQNFSWLDKQDYAITLLSFMKRSVDTPPLMTASMANDKHSLQNRIRSLLRERRRTPLTATLTAGLSGLLLCSALALGCVRTEAPEEGTASLKSDEPQVMYASPRVPARIVINAAHGGDDTGATYTRSHVEGAEETLYEKDLTLEIAQRLQHELEAVGAEVVMTRTADEYVSPQERVDIINAAEADFCISLHFESYLDEDARQGSFCFYNDVALPERFHKTTAEAAAQLQAEMVWGLSTADNAVQSLNEGLIIQEQSAIPVFLVSPATLSHPADRALITQPNFAQFAASSLRRGLEVLAHAPPTTIQDFADQWANAFYSRNGDAIYRLCADEELYLTIGDVTEDGGRLMGMSSPWPWFNDHVIEINADDSFNVYYYARTSDPLIFVIKHTVRCVETNGALLAAEVTHRHFSPVASRADFDEAYRYGVPDDYARYAMIAERRVGEANQKIYDTSSEPVSCARWQLQIDNAEARLEHEADSSSATVTFTWPDGSVAVDLIQYPSGVWVVQFDDDPLPADHPAGEEAAGVETE